MFLVSGARANRTHRTYFERLTFKCIDGYQSIFSYSPTIVVLFMRIEFLTTYSNRSIELSAKNCCDFDFFSTEFNEITCGNYTTKAFFSLQVTRRVKLFYILRIHLYYWQSPKVNVTYSRCSSHSSSSWK